MALEKTTAMRMFCGLYSTSGKAMVAGFDVYKNAEEIKKKHWLHESKVFFV